MSIIDLADQNINETPDPIVIDADSEVELRIIDAKMDNDKNGCAYLLPRFEVVGEPLAKDFTKFIGLPSKSLDEKQNFKRRSGVKHFGLAFDIDFSQPVDVNDLKGKTGWAIVGVEETDEYGQQNYVKRFIHSA